MISPEFDRGGAPNGHRTANSGDADGTPRGPVGLGDIFCPLGRTPGPMAQTDRQTDTSLKATWWSVTAYNSEISLLEDTASWPVWVKKVYGGREEGEKKGTLHFQGCIQCTKQQRLSAFKSWLPTAHLQIAIAKDALIKYAMKSETAVGDKKEVTNPYTYYTADMLALLMAKQVAQDHDRLYLEHRDPKVFKNVIWELAFVRTLEFNDRLFGQMMNPSFKNAWVMSLSYWLRKARLEDQKDSPVVALEVSEPV